MEKGKEEDETKKAFKYYNKAIELYPSYLFAYVNLGNLYAKFNERDEALKYYLKAKELDEHHDASCDYNLGVCYSNLGEMEKAEYYYLEELKTENPYIGTFYNLGILYKDKKEYDKSINYYLKALEKDKEDFNVWYNLACVYALKGDYDNAFSCLTYITYNKPTWLEGTKTDEEFDTLRKDSRYQQLFEK